MRANLTRLQTIARQLSTNLQFTEELVELLSTPPTGPQPNIHSLLKHPAPAGAQLREASYASLIVSLYGAFERFVENLVVDAAARIADHCGSYSALPSALAKHHSALTVEVLTLIVNDRYHGELQQRDLVEGMRDFLEASATVRINSGVFSHHTANLRWRVVRHLFERVGIVLSTVEKDLGNTPDRVVHSDEDPLAPLEIIDDLAQRRNEVSHGWDFDLLSIELQNAYVDAVVEVAEAMVASATSTVASHVVANSGRALGRPDRVFRRSIAGYNEIAHNIKVGDIIAVVGDQVRCGYVTEIQSNDTALEEVAAGRAAGLKLSSSLSSRNRLFLLPPSAGFLTA